MDVNPAVMYGSRGIPRNKRATASALTLAGYGANLRKYGQVSRDDLAAAVTAVKDSVANSSSHPLPKMDNPYSRTLAMLARPMSMGGLGDDDGEGAMPGPDGSYSSSSFSPSSSAAPLPTSSAGTSWLDVVNTVAGNLAKGVATKIGGAPRTTVNMAPPSSMPGWVIPAAVVGGAGVLFLLLRRH